MRAPARARRGREGRRRRGAPPRAPAARARRDGALGRAGPESGHGPDRARGGLAARAAPAASRRRPRRAREGPRRSGYRPAAVGLIEEEGEMSSRPVERVVDLIDPAANRVAPLSLEEARARAGSGAPGSWIAIPGSFAPVAKRGWTRGPPRYTVR